MLARVNSSKLFVARQVGSIHERCGGRMRRRNPRRDVLSSASAWDKSRARQNSEGAAVCDAHSEHRPLTRLMADLRSSNTIGSRPGMQTQMLAARCVPNMEVACKGRRKRTAMCAPLFPPGSARTNLEKAGRGCIAKTPRSNSWTLQKRIC